MNNISKGILAAALFVPVTLVGCGKNEPPVEFQKYYQGNKKMPLEGMLNLYDDTSGEKADIDADGMISYDEIYKMWWFFNKESNLLRDSRKAEAYRLVAYSLNHYLRSWSGGSRPEGSTIPDPRKSNVLR